MEPLSLGACVFHSMTYPTLKSRGPFSHRAQTFPPQVKDAKQAQPAHGAIFLIHAWLSGLVLHQLSGFIVSAHYLIEKYSQLSLPLTDTFFFSVVLASYKHMSKTEVERMVQWTVVCLLGSSIGQSLSWGHPVGGSAGQLCCARQQAS